MLGTDYIGNLVRCVGHGQREPGATALE